MTRAVIRRGYVVCNGTREFPVRVNSPNSTFQSCSEERALPGRNPSP